ncbi:hypothetical protein AHAS_Ahas06G0130900 [Arachis hypogaea]
MAIAQDGNANILPVAFAVVEGETKEAWSFFLSYLRHHVTPQPGVLVISDRHRSIDGSLNADDSLWKSPHAFQAFCTRHIASNFMTHFKNKDLKKVLINAAYSKSQREFAHYFGHLRGENEVITKWLDEIPLSQWAQYANEGELFTRKDSEALAQLQVGAKFSQTLMKAIEFNSKHINTMNVLHLPCRHVLAACFHARIDWRGFVHPVYCMESVFNVYRSEFRPIGHEDDWPSYDGPCIRPNPRMMRVKKGRPVSSRIRNNMDDVEHTGKKRGEPYKYLLALSSPTPTRKTPFLRPRIQTPTCATCRWSNIALSSPELRIWVRMMSAYLLPQCGIVRSGGRLAGGIINMSWLKKPHFSAAPPCAQQPAFYRSVSVRRVASVPADRNCRALPPRANALAGRTSITPYAAEHL